MSVIVRQADLLNMRAVLKEAKKKHWRHIIAELNITETTVFLKMVIWFKLKTTIPDFVLVILTRVLLKPYMFTVITHTVIKSFPCNLGDWPNTLYKSNTAVYTCIYSSNICQYLHYKTLQRFKNSVR